MTDPSKGQIGPGAYGASMVDKKNEPKYTMAGKYASAEKSGSPGPNQYNIPSRVVEKQGKTFGIKLKGGFEE
jgi:hypothetical protein